MTRETMLVVAGALRASNGLWLMHLRPQEKHHGGLWEFPGGKVESAEMPVFALIRELSEELGITVAPGDCIPVSFAESASDGHNPAIVILLYKVVAWSGQPKALEGGSVAWFCAEEIKALEKPPLDDSLAAYLSD